LENFREITKITLLQKFGTVGLRTVLETFIESNLNAAIDRNLMRLGTVLDLVMDTAEFQNQMGTFCRNAKQILHMSYENGQAEKYMEKLVNLESSGNVSLDLS